MNILVAFSFVLVAASVWQTVARGRAIYSPIGGEFLPEANIRHMHAASHTWWMFVGGSRVD